MKEHHIRKCIIITLFIFVTQGAIAQANVNDSIKNDPIQFRNEISINIGPMVSLYTSGQLPLTTVSTGYSHNFGKNHYLRVGVKVLPVRKDNNYGNFFGNSYMMSFSASDSVIHDTISIGSLATQTIKASVYIGYEHLFGSRKTKFLLGADLFAGFTHYSASESLRNYDVVYTIDTVHGGYNAYLSAIGTSATNIEVFGFHAGISPRLGIRYDASSRATFSMVFAPLFYVDLNTYSKTQVEQKPVLYIYGVPFIAEIGFAVKL